MKSFPSFMMNQIKDALKDLKEGRFVLIHDEEKRENETDLVILASAVKPKDVARMRTDAGGLICVPIGAELSEAVGLPYLSDVLM